MFTFLPVLLNFFYFSFFSFNEINEDSWITFFEPNFGNAILFVLRVDIFEYEVMIFWFGDEYFEVVFCIRGMFALLHFFNVHTLLHEISIKVSIILLSSIFEFSLTSFVLQLCITMAFSLSK